MLPYIVLALLAMLAVAGVLLRAHLRAPIRHYEGAGSVSRIYDTWTSDRVLEYYWGEHLHAGWYGDPPVKKNFIAAKIDFIDEMIRWGIAEPDPALSARLEMPNTPPQPVRILDVGCGIGGSVRHAAKRWKDSAHVTGITISRAQAKRATALSREQKVGNSRFLECDALHLSFADSSFDIVWAVESEMHMPDTERFIQEMVRVLKPGGRLIITAWNVRDTREAPLSKDEAEHLRLLVDEWAHTKFISIREYVEILERNDLSEIAVADWTIPTQPSWRQAVWEALRHPQWLRNTNFEQFWRLGRDAYTILRYHDAFQNGLCQYGMIRARKTA